MVERNRRLSKPDQKEKISKERVFVLTGATGFVGSRVKEILESAGGYNIIAPTRSELDITSRDSVFSFFDRTDAPVVFNFAAYTNVKEAETRKAEAYRVNVAGVKNLADAALAFDKFLVHISTGYDTNRGYGLTYYGETKGKGVSALRKTGCRHAVLRIDYPFGDLNSDHDYLHKILWAMGKEYPLYSDQWLTPTYIPDLAKVVGRMTEGPLEGTFNIVTWPKVTPYLIGTYLAWKKGLTPPRAGELAQKDKVRYTPNGGLYTSPDHTVLGIEMTNWKNAVDELI